MPDHLADDAEWDIRIARDGVDGDFLVFGCDEEELACAGDAGGKFDVVDPGGVFEAVDEGHVLQVRMLEIR